MEKIRYHFKHLTITLVFFVITVEIIMRLIGWVLMRPQHEANKIFPPDAHAFRILTLGESTTADYFADGKDNAWPRQLERKMNEKYGDESVRVFNGGVDGATTDMLVANLEGQVEKFNPHLVIMMVGINDNYYLEYKFDFNSKWKSFFYNIKVVKLYKWIKDNIKYRQLKIKTKPRYIVDNKMSFHERDEFNNFIETFKHNMETDNIGLAISKAEDILKKYQNNIKMVVQVMRGIDAFYMNRSPWLERKDDDPIKRRQMAIEKFIVEQYDQILSKTNNLAEAVSFKVFVYINQRNPSCMDTVLQLLEFDSLTPEEKITLFSGLKWCPKGHMNEMEVAKKVNYFQKQHNVAFSRKGRSVVSTQKNIKKMHRYLQERNIDVIFMQYPLANIDVLQYILSTEKITAGVDEYKNAIIKYWKPPPFQVDEKLKFLENRENFESALKKYDFDEIFIDRFATLFGHTSKIGHELIADNVVEYLEKKNIYPISVQTMP